MRLILLPGLEGTGDLFEPLLQVLHSPLIPQVVSYPTDRVLSYDELFQFVDRTLPKVEPFVVLADSFSGPIALHVAAQSFPNLQGVILCASFISNPFPWFFAWVPYVPQPLVERITQLDPPDMLIRLFAAGSDSPQTLLRLFHATKKKLASKVIASRLQAILHLDARENLRRCVVPVLYLRATHDRLVSARCLEEMRLIRPDLQVVEINSPHFLLQRRPKEAVSAINKFVEMLSEDRESRR